jgi:ubiquinone/menaquinone biosynthesis C-methylase UbiE
MKKSRVSDQNSEDPEWIEYLNNFSSVYDACNYSSGVQAAIRRASHQLVEEGLLKNQYCPEILEVGAGTGEHLTYVRHPFDHYTVTDLDEKALIVAKNKVSEKILPKCIFDIQNACQLDYPDNSFDRLIATHVLEHLPEPHLVLKEWKRVVKPEGIISILIPTDPGVAWRLGRTLGPRRQAKKRGIAYDYIMAREHVNSCTNLVALLRHYFPTHRERWWPTRIPSVDINLFFVCQVLIRKD